MMIPCVRELSCFGHILNLVARDTFNRWQLCASETLLRMYFGQEASQVQRRGNIWAVLLLLS